MAWIWPYAMMAVLALGAFCGLRALGCCTRRDRGDDD